MRGQANRFNIATTLILLICVTRILGYARYSTGRVSSNELCSNPIFKQPDEVVWTEGFDFAVLFPSPINPFNNQCSYFKNDKNGGPQSPSVTVAEIRLSREPWSDRNSSSATCKNIFKFSSGSDFHFCSLRGGMNLTVPSERVRFLPKASHYGIYSSGEFDAGFKSPGLDTSLSDFKFMQIYFVIKNGSNNILAWKVQQYEINREYKCIEGSEPSYLPCADYTNYLFDSPKESGEENLASFEQNVKNNTILSPPTPSDAIVPPATCPVVQTYKKLGQSVGELKLVESEGYTPVFPASSSFSNDNCVFAAAKDGQPDITVKIKGIYSLDSLGDLFPIIEELECPYNVITFETPPDHPTKICELNKIILHNSDFIPSIWRENRNINFVYAQFPGQSKGLPKDFVIFLAITEGERCSFVMQKYFTRFNPCARIISQYCSSFKCSDENSIWSTIVVKTIYDQYSKREYMQSFLKNRPDKNMDSKIFYPIRPINFPKPLFPVPTIDPAILTFLQNSRNDPYSNIHIPEYFKPNPSGKGVTYNEIQPMTYPKGVFVFMFIFFICGCSKFVGFLQRFPRRLAEIANGEPQEDLRQLDPTINGSSNRTETTNCISPTRTAMNTVNIPNIIHVIIPISLSDIEIGSDVVEHTENPPPLYEDCIDTLPPSYQEAVSLIKAQET